MYKQLDIWYLKKMICLVSSVLGIQDSLLKRTVYLGIHTHYNVIVIQTIAITFSQDDIINKFNFKQPHTYIDTNNT